MVGGYLLKNLNVRMSSAQWAWLVISGIEWKLCKSIYRETLSTV